MVFLKIAASMRASPNNPRHGKKSVVVRATRFSTNKHLIQQECQVLKEKIGPLYHLLLEEFNRLAIQEADAVKDQKELASFL